jgi:chromosome segregation ATPase
MSEDKRRTRTQPMGDTAWIRRSGAAERLSIPQSIDAEEPTKPVTIAPPMLSQSHSSELQNAFSDFAAAHNAAEVKNFEARHTIQRIDRVADDVAELREGAAAASARAERANDLLTSINVGLVDFRKELAKLHRSRLRHWQRIKSLETDTTNLWQVVRRHTTEIGTLQQTKRDAEQQAVGKQALITRGKFAAGAAASVLTFVVAKWQWIVSHLK